MEALLRIACLLAGVLAVYAQCPPSWVKIENSCYRAFGQGLTYDAAAQSCRRFVGCDGISPGHLACPTSFEERRAVRKLRFDILQPLRGNQIGEGQRLRPRTVWLGFRLGQGANSSWESTEQYDNAAMDQFWGPNRLQPPGFPQQPGFQQPGVGRPGFQQPGVGRPGFQQPGFQQQPGVGRPGFQRPGQRPGFQQPQQPGWGGTPNRGPRFDPTNFRWNGRCMTLPGQMQVNGAIQKWGHVACNTAAAYICEISAPGVVNNATFGAGGFNSTQSFGPQGGGRGGWQGGQGGGRGGWGQGGAGAGGGWNPQGGAGAGGRWNPQGGAGAGGGWNTQGGAGGGRFNPGQQPGGGGGRFNPGQQPGGGTGWNQGGAGGAGGAGQWPNRPNQGGAGGAGQWPNRPNQGGAGGTGQWPQQPQQPNQPWNPRQGGQQPRFLQQAATP